MISRLRVAAHPVNPCRPARAESHHRHLHTSDGCVPCFPAARTALRSRIGWDTDRIRCDTSSDTHKYQQFQTPFPSDCYYAQGLCLSSMAQSLRHVTP